MKVRRRTAQLGGTDQEAIVEDPRLHGSWEGPRRPLRVPSLSGTQSDLAQLDKEIDQVIKGQPRPAGGFDDVDRQQINERVELMADHYVAGRSWPSEGVASGAPSHGGSVRMALGFWPFQAGRLDSGRGCAVLAEDALGCANARWGTVDGAFRRGLTVANRDGRILITCDIDFLDDRCFPLLDCPCIILLLT